MISICDIMSCHYITHWYGWKCLPHANLHTGQLYVYVQTKIALTYCNIMEVTCVTGNYIQILILLKKMIFSNLHSCSRLTHCAICSAEFGHTFDATSPSNHHCHTTTNISHICGYKGKFLPTTCHIQVKFIYIVWATLWIIEKH